MRTEHTHYLVNNLHIFVYKMTEQSLKLAKFMTNQVVNMFGHF